MKRKASISNFRFIVPGFERAGRVETRQIKIKVNRVRLRWPLHAIYMPCVCVCVFLHSGKPVRRAACFYTGAMACGLLFFASSRSSWHRLTGQRPNEADCKAWGIPYPAK